MWKFIYRYIWMASYYNVSILLNNINNYIDKLLKY